MKAINLVMTISRYIVSAKSWFDFCLKSRPWSSLQTSPMDDSILKIPLPRLLLVSLCEEACWVGHDEDLLRHIYTSFNSLLSGAVCLKSQMSTWVPASYDFSRTFALASPTIRHVPSHQLNHKFFSALEPHKVLTANRCFLFSIGLENVKSATRRVL